MFIQRSRAIAVLALLMFSDTSTFAASIAQVSDPPIQAVAHGVNTFAVALYAQLRSNQRNLFFSPYSIDRALAMVHGGARGTTADEISRTLNLPDLKPADLDAAMIGLSHRLSADVASDGYELHVASAMWAQAGTTFLQNFVEQSRANFGAELTVLNFTDSAGAATAMNLWVSKKTNDRIKNLFNSGGISATTKLILTDAIYFKGAWTQSFNAQETRDMPWNGGRSVDASVAAGNHIKVPMMFQSGAFDYVKERQLAALDMPYQGSELSMLILLPDDPAGLEDVEKTLGLARLKAIVSHLRREPLVDVSFPRFNLETGYDLSRTLENMGMRSVYSTEADLSGIDGSRDLVVSSVVHKAFLRVDETGTEAAAATGATITEFGGPAPPPRPTFTADHPFVFLIRDNKAGTILFMGRVMNPAQ